MIPRSVRPNSGHAATRGLSYLNQAISSSMKFEQSTDKMDGEGDAFPKTCRVGKSVLLTSGAQNADQS